MDKSPDAFRTISEVAADLDLPQHVLRFWETRFVQIKPLKRGGGRRYYRPDDIDLLKGIRHLLYGEGYTIRGVQRILKEQGVRFVTEVWQEGAPQPPPAGTRWEAEPPLDRVVAEDWTPEAEAETEEPSPFDEPAAHWPEPEAAWPDAGEAMTAWADTADEDAHRAAPHVAAPEWAAPSPMVAPAQMPAPASLSSPPLSSITPPAGASAMPTPAAASGPRTPFAIGRATPLDPNFRPRLDGATAADFEPRFEPIDAAEAERAAQGFAPRLAGRPPLGPDATPRPRAERIAGFATAPHATRSVTFDPSAARPFGSDPRSGPPDLLRGPTSDVTPLRPGLEPGRGPVLDPATGRPAIEPPPLATGPARPSRLPAGLRPTAAAPEPQRSGLGQFFDRLRPGAALGGESDDGAASLPRSVQSLSRDEIRRLQSTLFELLECKRLLDQIR